MVFEHIAHVGVRRRFFGFTHRGKLAGAAGKLCPLTQRGAAVCRISKPETVVHARHRIPEGKPEKPARKIEDIAVPAAAEAVPGIGIGAEGRRAFVVKGTAAEARAVEFKPEPLRCLAEGDELFNFRRHGAQLDIIQSHRATHREAPRTPRRGGRRSRASARGGMPRSPHLCARAAPPTRA